MKFVDSRERRQLEALANLSDCNQFLPERVALERQALGPAFIEYAPVWHVEADLGGVNPNLPGLSRAAESLAPRLRDRLAGGAEASEQDLILYEGLVRYLLFSRYEDDFYALILEGERGEQGGRPARSSRRVPAFKRHAADVAQLLQIPGVRFPFEIDAAHLFAWGYQIRRAWQNTFRQIYGGSMPAAQLRAAVWQSIFTHDPRRYRRGLHERMGDIPTLIVGESGTGKELVARAIGRSRYIAFEAEAQCFSEDYTQIFYPINLSALSPSLVESELFGHKRGAFTGATEDRAGWFETCPAAGSVFLDEIGELSPEIQVKLLRVLQARTFQRVGEIGERSFEGKIIAATNRDLALEMSGGEFRRDFYYRLSGDVIRTPTLRELLAEAPDELRNLVLVLARRVAGDELADDLANEVVAHIEQTLGHDYPWRGNVRELEQCVRNVLIRGVYRPLPEPETSDASRRVRPAISLAIERGELSAEDLLRQYCTHVYARVGSYEEAARRLGLDRRTIKARIDSALLAELRSERGPDGGE